MMETTDYLPSWRRFFEFVHDVLACPGPQEPLTALVQDYEELLPADLGVAMFHIQDNVPYCTRCPDFASSMVSAFNEHYSRCCPQYPPPTDTLFGPVEWVKFQDTEYHQDFNVPLGIRHSLGYRFVDPVTNSDTVVMFNRSGPSRCRFSQEEATALEYCMESLVSIRRLQCSEAVLRRQWIQPEEISVGNRLTPREMEVALHLHRRTSMRRIAEELQISPRTVERHVLHIYQKFGVQCRQEFLEASAVFMRR